MDPCSALPSLPLIKIFGQLDASNLGRCAAVSTSWRSISESEELWKKLCQDLWHGKAYVSSALRDLPNKRSAWISSMEDSRRREISKEDLCSFTWDLSFKESASRFHYGSGGRKTVAPLRRYFHADQTVTAPEGDPLEGAAGALEPRPWAFRHEEDGVKGLYVQVGSYPYLHISRLPDWGWKMENMWVTLTSNHEAGPNPGKGKEGSTGREVRLNWLLAFLHVGQHYEDEEEVGDAQDGEEGEEEEEMEDEEEDDMDVDV